MRKSALAHFRQLCCLGLGGPAVMPSLLAAMHDLIPCETNGFFWADEAGRMAGFQPEYVIPAVVDSLVGDFDGLVDRVMPLDFTATMRRGKPVGNLLSLFDEAFYRGPLYHLIYRPYNLHHAIDAVVRDTPSSQGAGAFVVGRSARQQSFSPLERDTLQRLLPYLAHAMHRRDESATTDYADSGECGLVILDQSGKVAYISARARQILYFASHPAAAPERPPGKEAGPGSPVLQRVFDNLIRIFQERDAAPPVVEHRNAWGRFIYRAHWLEPGAAATGPLVGVTVAQQEPTALVMMRKMHAAGLSERQKEVGLLLGQNQSFDAIATRLHVSRSTAKDYAQRLYRKLNVHTREELLQRLH